MLGGLAQVAADHGQGLGRCFFGHRRSHVGQVQVQGAQAENLRALAAVAQGFQRAASDQVLQLAHIARPAVGQQGRLGISGQAQAAQAHARTVLFEEEARQQQHITPALAQRWHLQRVDAQTVVEVGAVAAIAHLFGEVAVGGGNQAHVHLVLLVRAQSL